MDSTLTPKPTDPLVRYFEQIAQDEQMARTPADDAARHDRPSFGRSAVRGFIGLLLAACIGVAAVAWQSYGDAAKPIIARWAPQFVLSSSLPLENPGPPAQQSPPAVQTSAATAAPPQPAPLAQTAAEGGA